MSMVCTDLNEFKTLDPGFNTNIMGELSFI